MVIYKIFRSHEWAELQTKGVTAGASVDLTDGYIHFSTPAQAVETAAKHFAGQDGLILVAVDAALLQDDLQWEVSRGGAKFPHLYRALRMTDVIWSCPLPLIDGAHQFPARHRVYKIFTPTQWDAFQTVAAWDGSPLDMDDGFIHLSGPQQVMQVLDHFFAGVSGLTLGTVDLAPDEPHIRWEDPGNGDLFPHLYRALRSDDVTASHVIALTDGVHALPPLT